MTTPEDRLRNLESTFQQLATKSDTPDLRRAINDPDLSLRDEIARAGTTMAQRDLSTTRFFGAMAVVGATFHDDVPAPAALKYSQLTMSHVCASSRGGSTGSYPSPHLPDQAVSRFSPCAEPAHEQLEASQASPSTDVNQCVPLSSFADPGTAQTTDLIRTSQRPQT